MYRVSTSQNKVDVPHEFHTKQTSKQGKLSGIKRGITQ